MSEITPNTTKICPTCGTRLNINASRCSVCGANLRPSSTADASSGVKASRLPELTLSLPVLIGLVLLLLAVGAGGVYAYFQTQKPAQALGPGQTPFTATASLTVSPTITPTPTLEPTETIAITDTPLPPRQYTVVTNDSCLSIAYVYGVSVNSIIQINKLSVDCPLSVGQVLLIPVPTATPQPSTTPTLDATGQAQADCKTIQYIVKSGDTLGGIAANYAVKKEAIMQYSGMKDENVLVDEKLIIPLCEQSLEASTATPIPPYPAPNLLLPADGSIFKAADAVTLQWAAVGDLRQSEAYAVTIIDATDGNNRKAVTYVTDTKLIVPDSLRPTGADAHIFYWTVLPVRQVGTDKDTGNPVWSPAGDLSLQRSFSWAGGPAPAATPAK